MDNFYVYLPSNVSDGSRAEKFSTTLSNELNLEGNWSVSLAEMNYTSSTYTFRGERMRVSLDKHAIIQEKKLAGLPKKIVNFYNYGDSVAVVLSFKNGKYSFENNINKVINPNRELISISLSESLSKKIKLKTFYNDFELPVSSTAPFIENMTDDDYWLEEWRILSSESFTISLKRRKIATIDELIDYIQKTVLEKLNVVKYNSKFGILEVRSKKIDLQKEENEKLSIVIERGYHVELLDGLHFVLGFSKKILNSTTVADFQPHLNRDTDSMFIYSNIVNYSLVGHSESPILRMVPFQSDGETGTTKSWASLNLIYKQVRLKSIRSIDIEIRTDSGEYFPFVDNSISQLVLHFKRI